MCSLVGVLGWLVGIGALAIPGLGPFIAAAPIVPAHWRRHRIRKIRKSLRFKLEKELDEESDPSQPSRFISEALQVASSIEKNILNHT